MSTNSRHPNLRVWWSSYGKISIPAPKCSTNMQWSTLVQITPTNAFGTNAKSPGKAFVEYKGGEYYYVHESHSWDYGYGNSEFLWFVPKAVSKGVAPSGG